VKNHPPIASAKQNASHLPTFATAADRWHGNETDPAALPDHALNSAVDWQQSATLSTWITVGSSTIGRAELARQRQLDQVDCQGESHTDGSSSQTPGIAVVVVGFAGVVEISTNYLQEEPWSSLRSTATRASR
jgi:hypothetical protein